MRRWNIILSRRLFFSSGISPFLPPLNYQSMIYGTVKEVRLSLLLHIPSSWVIEFLQIVIYVAF